MDGYTLNPGDNPWDDLAALGEIEVYDRTGQSYVECEKRYFNSPYCLGGTGCPKTAHENNR